MTMVFMHGLLIAVMSQIRQDQPSDAVLIVCLVSPDGSLHIAWPQLTFLGSDQKLTHLFLTCLSTSNDDGLHAWLADCCDESN